MIASAQWATTAEWASAHLDIASGSRTIRQRGLPYRAKGASAAISQATGRRPARGASRSSSPEGRSRRAARSTTQ
jgi:hypothetical protein